VQRLIAFRPMRHLCFGYTCFLGRTRDVIVKNWLQLGGLTSHGQRLLGVACGTGFDQLGRSQSTPSPRGPTGTGPAHLYHTHRSVSGPPVEWKDTRPS
jgi:hypothetical protein